MPTSRKWLSNSSIARLGCASLVFFFLFCSLCFVGTIFLLVQDTSLSRNGVLAQGTVVNIEATQCGKSPGNNYSVRFTDRAGRVQIASFGCGYSAPPNLSRGDSITIVYLPDDPTVIEPSEDTVGPPILHIFGAIFFGLIELLLLGGGIRMLIWWKRQKRVESRRLHPPVIFAFPTAGGHAQSDREAKGQPGSSPMPEREPFDVPQTTQASLFDVQNEQEEHPNE